MAVQPIFGGGQLPVNVVQTQNYGRGVADAAPLQMLQSLQVRSLQRESNESAERATTVLSDVGQTPTYDVHARVEPTPGDGRRRGRLFDRRA